MHRHRLLLALAAVAAVVCFGLGQLVKDTSADDPRSVASKRTRDSSRKPGTPAERDAVVRTAHAAQQPASHPDQIEAELRSIAESFSNAGLTDEARRVRELARRVHEEYHQQLLAASQTQAATVQPTSNVASEIPVIISVKWFDIRQTPEGSVALKKLFKRNPASDQWPEDTAFPGLVYGLASSEQIHDWISKRIVEAEVAMLVDRVVAQDSIRGNAREPVLMHGSIVSRATTRESGQDVVLASTDNGALPASIDDIQNRPGSQFVGTTIRTRVDDYNDNIFRIWFQFKHSEFQEGKAAADQTNRHMEAELEIRDDQSLVFLGLPSERTMTIVQRAPVLGDIPLIGPSLFSKKKQETERFAQLCIISYQSRQTGTRPTMTAVRQTEKSSGRASVDGGQTRQR